MTDQKRMDSHREIIQDFADEIIKRKKSGAKPSKEVIFFRKEHLEGKERPVVEVPVELLRFRKHNGRIASDVLSYEKNKEPLNEKSDHAQLELRKFLEEKDPEPTQDLISSIRHAGQREAAIITADGFLINGNRRKMAFDLLKQKFNDNEKYKWLKVVILPGKDDKKYGGPPTLKEIEQIENRYQLQKEGKAEYYNFDKALSMRRKISIGITLQEQLRDDPKYANLENKDFNKELKKCEEDYIKPLGCIDDYLSYLGRDGLFSTISGGIADREGQWQAFVDYFKSVKKKLIKDTEREKMGIEEDEIGATEDLAFKLIRNREFKGKKLHNIMRDLPKMLGNPKAKKALFKLNKIEIDLTHEKCFDSEGKEYSASEQDKIWANSNKTHQTIMHSVSSAYNIIELEKEIETPLTLLETALNKLQHKDLHPEQIRYDDISKALRLINKLQKVIFTLKQDFFELEKKQTNEFKKLKIKFEG